MFITADQPLYAICKAIQWKYPTSYGLGKVFFILGGLHIEKVIEDTLGDYFKESGITDSLKKSKVMTCSDASFLSGGNIMRTRYNYQIMAVVLYRLMTNSYELSDASNLNMIMM